MRVLMLGNRFTSTPHLPDRLARYLGAEVTAHTRGGARLAEHLNPKTRMGQRTQAALSREHWDYVVLQEMSNGPITAPARFLDSAAALCRLIREAGTTPVLYTTWGYLDPTRLEALGLSQEEMARQLSAVCHQAAQANGALVADVGLAFLRQEDQTVLYGPDGVHPSEVGAELAAQVLADTMPP